MATLLQRQFSNRVYWEKREREARENYLQTEAQELAEIERIYRNMAQWAEDEINRFYGKYAGLEGIDITDAKKRVTQLDIEQYQELAKKYVADRNFSDKASEELRLYNATMRINRLEMLNARIGLDLVAGIDEIDKYCGDKMTERAEAEFRRLAGILGETIDYKDMEKQAKAIVNASFKNATYSERLWSHMDRLRSEINIELQRGLIAGISSREMARRIAVLSNDYTSNYSKSLRDAERLMVTELRRVQTDVAMQTYKAEGITQYMYMAVNPKACEVCRAINGKIYNVREGEIGLNLPPMHPRCHCTTAPWQDPAEYEAWLNYLEQGGKTVDWEQMSSIERQRYDNFMQGNTQPNVEVQEIDQDDERERQDAAIEWYVSGEGMWINDYLRGRLDTKLTENEQLLYDALARATDAPLPKSIKTLWRSVDASALLGNMTGLEREQFREALYYGETNAMQGRIANLKGKTITEKGFLSTTTDKDVAVYFGDFTGSETPVVIEFKNITPKVKGKDLEAYDYEEDPQHEVLLHPKTKYKILDIGVDTDEDGDKYIKLDAEIET